MEKEVKSIKEIRAEYRKVIADAFIEKREASMKESMALGLTPHSESNVAYAIINEIGYKYDMNNRLTVLKAVDTIYPGKREELNAIADEYDNTKQNLRSDASVEDAFGQ